MEFQQLLQFCIDNKEWIAVTLTGLATGLLENRRAARKAKREKYLININASLEKETTYFKFQESLRKEQQIQYDRLNSYIKDTDKRMAEMKNQLAIAVTTLQQIERFVTSHKFEQRSDIKDAQELNDENIAATRSAMASVEREEWASIKSFILKSSNNSDEIGVIISRVDDRNESFDNRYELPVSSDILA